MCYINPRFTCLLTCQRLWWGREEQCAMDCEGFCGASSQSRGWSRITCQPAQVWPPPRAGQCVCCHSNGCPWRRGEPGSDDWSRCRCAVGSPHVHCKLHTFSSFSRYIRYRVKYLQHVIPVKFSAFSSHIYYRWRAKYCLIHWLIDWLIDSFIHWFSDSLDCICKVYNIKTSNCWVSAWVSKGI